MTRPARIVFCPGRGGESVPTAIPRMIAKKPAESVKFAANWLARAEGPCYLQLAGTFRPLNARRQIKLRQTGPIHQIPCSDRHPYRLRRISLRAAWPLRAVG